MFTYLHIKAKELYRSQRNFLFLLPSYEKAQRCTKLAVSGCFLWGVKYLCNFFAIRVRTTFRQRRTDRHSCVSSVRLLANSQMSLSSVRRESHLVSVRQSGSSPVRTRRCSNSRARNSTRTSQSLMWVTCSSSSLFILAESFMDLAWWRPSKAFIQF